MKFRCIYCAHAFEAEALPPACPSCAAAFTRVVTPGTPVKDIVRALAKNGRSPLFNLVAEVFDIADEKAPAEGFAVACAPDDREPTQDPGMVAVTDSLVDAVAQGYRVLRALRDPLREAAARAEPDADGMYRYRVVVVDHEPRPAGCACHIEAGDSPCPVHGDDDR